MNNKYQMSKCGKYKKPFISNLESAIQDQDWRFVRIILEIYAETEQFRREFREILNSLFGTKRFKK